MKCAKHVQGNRGHMVSRAPVTKKGTCTSAIEGGGKKSMAATRTRLATYRHLSEVATEDTCDIMRRVMLLFPIE